MIEKFFGFGYNIIIKGGNGFRKIKKARFAIGQEGHTERNICYESI